MDDYQEQLQQDNNLNQSPDSRSGGPAQEQPRHLPSGRKYLASPLVRFGLIAFLTLLLLIPLGLVQDMVYEREDLYHEAAEDIAAAWGTAQTVSGPVLVVPYEVLEEKRVSISNNDYSDGTQELIRKEYVTRYKVILPAAVHFDSQLDPEVRYRGIYRQVLYNAPVSINGTFILPLAADFAPNPYRVCWDKAWLAVGLTDLKAISETGVLNWAGTEISDYKPGTMAENIVGEGFHIKLPLSEASAGAKQVFSLRLKVRGSGGMAFTPVGESTTITMAGTWPHPSFQGSLLPVERSVTDKDFAAKWVISNLTRSYPQTGELYENASPFDSLRSFTAGVDLFEPVSLYRMSLRAANYGILFIAVTFTALFAFEMVIRQRMHLLQYAMVGLAMSVFYLILLSLAEHTGFGAAFAAAAAVTVGMNSLYLAATLRSWKRGLLMGALLCGLYGLLFSLLRMEDFALLVGTGLVVAMMAALMFVTRKLPQAAP